MLRIKQLVVFVVSLMLATAAMATRIHTVSPNAPTTLKMVKGAFCKPITLKNRSAETLYITIRYVDDGMDDWYLGRGQAAEVDMENDVGDCDPGAFISVETLDHYEIFRGFVKAGKKVEIDPFQLKFLRS